ncbi:MAG: hypothetical protein E7222_00540 [Clostridiales bacterium]|nr:hypothetical protein [Clostridiales bacterium]
MANNLEITNYSNIEELAGTSNGDFSIYGELDKYANKFECIHMLESGFKFGLSYNYTGLKPEILETGDTRLFVGFDKIILCIDQYNNQLLQEQTMGSLFYEFIDVEQYALLVAICELDLIVMNYEGETIWSMGFRDIIEAFSRDGELLKIKCSDGDNFVFNIHSGQLIND